MTTAQPLTQEAFQKLIQGAESIEEDSHGPKVYRFENGEYLKVFRRKRLLSSALLRPYSQRFWENASRLEELGIPTVQPLQLFKLATAGWTAIHYKALPGETLRDLFTQHGELSASLFEQLIELFKDLHRKGIYFRSLHLGNIVRTPEGQLGLIDIADLQFLAGPLSKDKIRRNLAHFERYLKHNGLADFPFDTLSNRVSQP
ncbi:toluene tolerance protein [Pseudomonas sediminis]|uniref:Toluene tolerance protein n=1 Tax=Pseudomonas sediminis TaxID=1691904 RepID=A0A2G5FW04_9PSED|nr:toluene tolerance protein [Pseudomonas sediminis]PIA72238.1 toluene tolerance protein [Pseudomonas sediminis]